MKNRRKNKENQRSHSLGPTSEQQKTQFRREERKKWRRNYQRSNTKNFFRTKGLEFPERDHSVLSTLREKQKTHGKAHRGKISSFQGGKKEILELPVRARSTFFLLFILLSVLCEGRDNVHPPYRYTQHQTQCLKKSRCLIFIEPTLCNFENTQIPPCTLGNPALCMAGTLGLANSSHRLDR